MASAASCPPPARISLCVSLLTTETGDGQIVSALAANRERDSALEVDETADSGRPRGAGGEREVLWERGPASIFLAVPAWIDMLVT